MEYYHNNQCLPVYEHPRKGYSCEEIVKILLNPMFRNDLLCSVHPVLVENNISFVIDLTKLKDPNDVRFDELGTWKCTGSRCLEVAVKLGDTDCQVVDKSSPNAMIVNVRRQHHVHGTDPDMHRMIAFLEGAEKGTCYTLPHCYIIVEHITTLL